MARIAALRSRLEAAGRSNAVSLNRRVAHAVAVLGAVAVAYQVVMLAAAILNAVRQPMRVAEFAEPAPPGPETASGASDAIAVVDAHLFGVFRGATETPVSKTSQEAAAPDTTLSLALTGVLFANDLQHREAIIASGGHERAYRVGQEVDAAAGAKVRDVRTASVLLDRQGTIEALRLVRNAEWPPPAGGSAAVAADAAGARGAGKAARPGRSDFLRLMRKTQDGRVVGFAVMPGPNRDAFDVLGLQSSDVITGIDGVALADRGDSLLLERLARGGSLTLTVLRSGVPREIHVDADRLPSVGG